MYEILFPEMLFIRKSNTSFLPSKNKFTKMNILSNGLFSGEMSATIASSVMEEYGPAFQTGSVLLLHGVTVLSPVGVRTTTGTREHSRKHYLNITLNTMLTIYTPDDSGNVVRTLINELDKNELYRQAAAPKSCPRAIVEEEEDEIFEASSSNNQSLFTLNDSLGKNSSYLNQTIYNHQQQTNYRSPRIAGNNAQNFVPKQPQKIHSPFPGGVNSPQYRGSQSNQPRASTPVMNRSVTRPPFMHQPQSRSQYSPSQVKTVNSLKPSRPQIVSSTPIISGGDLSCSSSNSNVTLKEIDEKEVNDLLDGVDAESLFGDF